MWVSIFTPQAAAVPFEPPFERTYKERTWMAIATLCVDEGNHRSPDGQLNSVSQYMNMTMSNHAAYARAHGYDYMARAHASLAYTQRMCGRTHIALNITTRDSAFR